MKSLYSTMLVLPRTLTCSYPLIETSLQFFSLNNHLFLSNHKCPDFRHRMYIYTHSLKEGHHPRMSGAHCSFLDSFLIISIARNRILHHTHHKLSDQTPPPSLLNLFLSSSFRLIFSLIIAVNHTTSPRTCIHLTLSRDSTYAAGSLSFPSSLFPVHYNTQYTKGNSHPTYFTHTVVL